MTFIGPAIEFVELRQRCCYVNDHFPNTRLGRYEIVSLLGEGGMGEVYRARDTQLGREVAVKVLSSCFSDNAERLHRFEQEASAAGALNHPNILSVYDVGSHDSSPYVVCELLEGETLRERLSAGAISGRKVARIDTVGVWGSNPHQSFQ